MSLKLLSESREPRMGPVVKNLLLESDPCGARKLEEVAGIIRISSRTLRARLAKEKLSFRAILNEVVALRGRALLEGTEFSVQEIAIRLGFSQPSNFIRAFSKVIGMTPGEYRKRNQIEWII